MNGIRFVHTDYLRLAGSIAGLAAAPDWLRRLARDATRGAVSRVFEIATTRHADFVFIGGGCSDAPEFDSSVFQWLQEPVRNLRQQGIRIVMAADQPSEFDRLADCVVRADERLLVTRIGDQVSLHTSSSGAAADLAISVDSPGTSTGARVNYIYRPQTRYLIDEGHGRLPIHSAGAPQSHGPYEQGEFGCLVVDADPDSGQIEAVFEATDPLRFETIGFQQPPTATTQDVCDAVVNGSLELARQQRRTTVVDWYMENAVECVGSVDRWQQESILESIRSTLQKGHLGVWPRRVMVSPPRARVSVESDSTATRELSALLFEDQTGSREEQHRAFAELLAGTRLLRTAA